MNEVATMNRCRAERHAKKRTAVQFGPERRTTAGATLFVAGDVAIP
jgi:hypothetical protein